MESGARQGPLIAWELWQPLKSPAKKNLALLESMFTENKLIKWGSPSFSVLPKRTNGRGR